MMCKLCGGQMEFEEGTWGCVANCLNSPSKTEVQTFQDTKHKVKTKRWMKCSPHRGAGRAGLGSSDDP